MTLETAIATINATGHRGAGYENEQLGRTLDIRL